MRSLRVVAAVLLPGRVEVSAGRFERRLALADRMDVDGMLAGRQIRERRRYFYTIGRVLEHRLADVRAAHIRQLGACARGVDEGNEPEPAHYERGQTHVHSRHGSFVLLTPCTRAHHLATAGSVPAHRCGAPPGGGECAGGNSQVNTPLALTGVDA